MNEEKLEEVIETPMGDDDIKRYLPDAHIVKYNDLNNIEKIEDLLPNNKDYVIMLVEENPNTGHWIALSRLGNTVEVFDSLGGKPDSWLSWLPKSKEKELGQGKKRMTELLNKYGGRVVYNPVRYQKSSGDINTCGRHCVWRVKNVKEGKDLDDYYKMMKKIKDNRGLDYDEIVSLFIKE